MNSFYKGKNVVLGVSGGIAAYKSADLVSRLVKLGINVNVIMTKNAAEFVAPLTFQSLSNNPVATNTFEKVISWDIEHIALAKKADVFAIVPASANVIGKIASGIADDMLTTTFMASTAPKLIAPAMNTNMFENPIVQENIGKLEKLGYHIVYPESGRLACGDIGAGKLANVEDILEAILSSLTEKILSGKKVLISAGPTREKIDPVRYISNFSSGKMGYSLAKAAHALGAQVVLVSGPTSLRTPYGIVRVDVESTQEMYDAIMSIQQDFDIIIKSAAVLDYKPIAVASQKIKKTDSPYVIELERTQDILYSLGKVRKDNILVGFAAETNDVDAYAKGKLENKNCDMIVANDVSNKEIGFNSQENEVALITKNSISRLPQMDKEELAFEILKEISRFSR